MLGAKWSDSVRPAFLLLLPFPAFYNDCALSYDQERRSTQSSTSDKNELSIHQACFLEAAALDPPHLQLAFSARRLSQRGTDLLWLRGNPAWLSGLLGHPGGAGDSAQRIEHLPFWGTVGPRTHSLVHSFVQACPGPCGGPAPEIRRGKP